MLDLTSKPYVAIMNIQNMLKDDNCIFRFEFSELLSLQACNMIQDITKAPHWSKHVLTKSRKVQTPQRLWVPETKRACQLAL